MPPDDPRALPDLTADLAADARWAPWPAPIVIRSTSTTMADVERLAASGAQEGTTVIAEEQTAGRGRHGREWASRPFAGLWLSLLVRPHAVTPDHLGWLTLAVGVGVARGIGEATGLDLGLKWPNDVICESGKVGGILAERLVDGAVVIGMGINVDQADDELPDGATSLRLIGSTTDRARVLVCVLGAVAAAYRDWRAEEDMSAAYRALCRTLGSRVRVTLPDGPLVGRAVDIDASGHLMVVDHGGAIHVVAAGDVIHVRPDAAD